MDNVTEGMENYGGKIMAVETDLKKLGKSRPEMLQYRNHITGSMHYNTIYSAAGKFVNPLEFSIFLHKYDPKHNQIFALKSWK